jgi:integrase
LPVFTKPDDLVFCSTLGNHLDPSALRRAQDAAKLRPLRFHDLRHSFGSARRARGRHRDPEGLDGPRKLTTTERYLHATPRHTDVVGLDRAFAAQPALPAPEEQPAPAGGTPATTTEASRR